jgi:hypothetical protein
MLVFAIGCAEHFGVDLCNEYSKQYRARHIYEFKTED